jgi:hypothetical protein
MEKPSSALDSYRVTNLGLIRGKKQQRTAGKFRDVPRGLEACWNWVAVGALLNRRRGTGTGKI